mgnify:CR=1 FL=1
MHSPPDGHFHHVGGRGGKPGLIIELPPVDITGPVVVSLVKNPPSPENRSKGKALAIMNHPAIGQSIHDLDTPALILDLDVSEKNLQRMAQFFSDRPAQLRPHFKNH